MTLLYDENPTYPSPKETTMARKTLTPEEKRQELEYRDGMGSMADPAPEIIPVYETDPREEVVSDGITLDVPAHGFWPGDQPPSSILKATVVPVPLEDLSKALDATVGEEVPVPPLEPTVVTHANALSETEWREHQKAKHPDKADYFTDPDEEVKPSLIITSASICKGTNCNAPAGSDRHSLECMYEHDRLCQAAEDADEAALKAKVEPNNDEVICPSCATQFRAIPVNVQTALSYAGYEPPYMKPWTGTTTVLSEGEIHTVPNAVAKDLNLHTIARLNNQDLAARVYATVGAALHYSHQFGADMAPPAHVMQKMRALMLTALRDIKSVHPGMAQGEGEGQDLTP